MADSSKWTDSFLDDMRKKGDPFADRAAAALFEAIHGKTESEVGSFIAAFVSKDFSKKWQNQSAIPDPPVLVNYFENFDDFQLTAEEIECLERGSDFFEIHGPMATFALGVRSLLKQYAHTKAIEVLRLTTLLVRHVNRRILETMQFVLDVMAPRWAEVMPDGDVKLNLKHPGLLSVKQLRLVHAMIRYRLQHKMYDTSLGDYDIEKLGFPINQEDMVFAIHTFSLEIIEGLRQMGHEVTDEQADNYFKCWKIIGRALGVSRELEPASYQDAWDLQNKIYQRHFTLPNTAGPILATALMNWFVNSVPLLKEKLLITFIKEFNGPENFEVLQKNLQINLDNAHEDLENQVKIEMKIGDETPAPSGDSESESASEKNENETAVDKFFLQFIKTLITVERGGKDEHFRIGDGFMAAWDLNKMSDSVLTKAKVFWLAVISFLQDVLKKLFGSKDKSNKKA